ncbi:MAG: hypothetical protein ACREDR_27305 [Blastocatellia bacterium]
MPLASATGIIPGGLTPQAPTDFNANTNQLAASKYDQSGNQTADQTSLSTGNAYGYDAENHMTSCTVSGTSSS